MADIDKKFSGSIPEFYDTYMVPMIFKAYANDLANRTIALTPGSVLEIAAGSGVVPRALAPKLPDAVRYVVTDLNQPMLDHARNKQPTPSAIEWQQADALNLPFEDATFEVVICQFGAMFYPDKIKGFQEAHRVLKPGGALIFSVWDHIRENEFAEIATNAATHVFPDDPPLFLARTPHGYYDTDKVSDDLKQSGFVDITFETKADISKAPSPRHPAIAYCQGTPLRNEIEERDAGKLQAVTDKAAELIELQYGAGAVEAKIQAHIFTAKTRF